MSAGCGNTAIGFKLKLGSTGFASTLAMNTMASAVIRTDTASQARRTRRQRRPPGSWKTGDSAELTMIRCRKENLRLLHNKNAVHDQGPWTAPVNCWDWPEADCVPSRKEEHYAVRRPNQNPNELAGSEVRPQPPHCDKNSYIFLNHLLSSVASHDKGEERERQ